QKSLRSRCVADTSQQSTAKHFPPCHKGHSHSAETIRRAQSIHTHQSTGSRSENLPATCSRAPGRQVRTRLPKQTPCPPTLHARQTPTQLQSARLFPPTWNTHTHPRKRHGPLDVWRDPSATSPAPADDASSRPEHTSTTGKHH